MIGISDLESKNWNQIDNNSLLDTFWKSPKKFFLKCLKSEKNSPFEKFRVSEKTETQKALGFMRHKIEYRLCHLGSYRGWISLWEISYYSVYLKIGFLGFGIIGRKLVCGNFHTARSSCCSSSLPVFLGLLNNLMSKLAAASSSLVAVPTLKIMVTSLTLHFLFFQHSFALT